MPLVLADRVRETTTTTGTGTISLAGPVSGFQGFNTAIGNANTTYYTIVDAATGAWEVGLGTYTSSGSTLARTTVLSSSNSDALVPFGAGTKDVFVTQPAERAVYILGAGTGLAAGAAAFTANGVPYASATNTLTTGSALTFDGTNFNVVRAAATDQYMSMYADGTGPTLKFFGGAAGKIAGIVADSASASMYFTNEGNKPFVYAINGSEQMRLTSTGLGIGTNSPAYKLDVAGSSRIGASGASTALLIGSDASTTGGLVFSDATRFISGSIANNPYLFYVNNAEQMRLTSTGLGIGTTSPANKLVVSNAGANGFEVDPANSLMQTYNRSGGAYTAMNLLALSMAFKTGASPATTMLLDSSGNLGIGTSSPGSRIHGAVAANGTPVLTVQNTSTSQSAYGILFDTELNNAGSRNWALISEYTAAGDFHIVRSNAKDGNPFSAGTSVLALDSSGNLGLGVTPSAWDIGSTRVLQFTGGSVWSFSTSQINLLQNAFYNSSGNFIYTNTAAASAYRQISGAHSWYTAASGTAGNAITFTQAMTLDASGNLGIGASSPAYKLDMTVTAANNAGIRIYNSTSGTNNTVGISFSIANGFSSTNQHAAIQAISESSGNTLTSLGFYTSGGSNVGNATERMRLDSSGNLGLGVTPSATSGGYKNVQNGNAVMMGSTSDVSAYWNSNATFNSGWKYISNGTSSRYEQTALGGHAWFTAPSGTAGNAITFTQAMTLDASGNLGLGVTPPAWESGTQSINVGAGTSLWNPGSATVTRLITNAFRPTSGNYTYRNNGGATYYEQSGSTHAWYNSPSGTAGNAITFTQAMTLDASGNLGVGTTSPQRKLDIYDATAPTFALHNSTSGTGSTDGFLLFTLGSDTTLLNYENGYMAFSTNATERARITSGGAFLVGGQTALTSGAPAGTAADFRGGLALSAASAVNGAYQELSFPAGVYTKCSIRGYSTGTTDAGELRFFTAPAGDVNQERARIDSSGNLLVQATSSSVTSGVGHKIRPDAAAPFMGTVGSSTSGVDVTYSLYSTGAAAYRFYVGYNGTISATTTTISGISDVRLKENIRDLDDGLTAVMALKPRKFDWKAGKGKDIKDDRGFIAQEFEQVFPDMIDEWKDPAPEGEEPYKAVNANLIPTLVKAIQELKAEFDAYKATHP